jgi:predicted nucleotidyltransferase
MGMMGEISGETRGIGAALFSGVQQRVLGALFGHPDRTYFGNELARLTRSGKGALRRELERLLAAGLIEAEVIGRQKHFRANRAAPIFSELHSIVIKTFGLAEVIRAALMPLEPRIALAFVFGSVAKQSDSARSDIDLFVIADDLSYADLIAALEAAGQRLERPINPVLESRADFLRKRAEGNSFITRITAQPTIHVCGTERELLEPR